MVREINHTELRKKGRYTYFWLRKRDFTTEHAIQIISEKTHIQRRFFGYAGSKDRNAVTEQLCSVSGRIRASMMKDMEIRIAGYGDKPISLGTHLGNQFIITVRNIEDMPKQEVQFINYFDEQRFGTNADNHVVGRLIVKRRFREAVEKLMEREKELTGDHLQKAPNDFVGCLRRIPKKILTMYIHAYQGYLFNGTAAEIVRKRCRQYKCVAYSLGEFLFPSGSKIPGCKIPVIGFSTEAGNNKTGKIIRSIMEREDLNEKDFIIREIPELSSDGGQRSLLINVDDIKFHPLENDELNPGMKKLRMEFSLLPGSYATVVIKALFG